MITKEKSGSDKGENLSPLAAGDFQLASLWVTFRNIHIVVILILIFAMVQMVMLKRVCDAGMQTSTSLEHEGLPCLKQLGDLQEHLALFRLYSYEYLFARQSEQASKKQDVETIVAEAHQEFKKMESLLPTYVGRVLATNLTVAFDDLNHQFGLAHGLVNSDFAGAMHSLDQDIPPKVEKALAAADALAAYGYQLSAQQASATFGSFGWIKTNAIEFGTANIVISLGAVLFVVLAARRTRVQVTDSARRLQERSDELTRSLSLLHATLDSTADGIVAFDQQNQILCFNKKFVKLWGVTSEMMRRKRTTELLTLCSVQTTNPEDFLRHMETRGSAANPESSNEIRFNDGRVIECFANPQWNNREPAGMVFSFRDVTERKLAEAGLHYERNLLRALMDSSDDCIYFKDAESRFLRCSANMARLFGASGADEVVGKRDSDFFGEEHARDALVAEQTIIRTGEPLMGKVEKEVWLDGRVSWALTSKMPLHNEAGVIVGTFGISKNISAFKEAEAKLAHANSQLLDASRRAGMAEVATSVLHNVGNVLNSVNVSSSLVAEMARNSKGANLAKIVTLLQTHSADIGSFLNNDPKGKQLLDYLPKLAAHLTQEREDILRETGLLTNNIIHIKEIVAMQQSYAQASGVREQIEVSELVQDALRMNDWAMDRHNVKVSCELEKVPPILTEKHKVLQILINLLRNAKYACDDSGRTDKQIIVRVSNDDSRVKILVIDNGIGIPEENLLRIFNHGFTTRIGGHGFGLHSGANAAKELGGTLAVTSEGQNRGATFTLELPLKFQKNS